MHLEWREVTPGDGPAILTSVAEAEALQLRSLAKGRDVLEIGSAHGYSAVIMALAGARSITAIDPHGPTWLGDSLAIMRGNLEAYGVADRVEIVQDYSQNAMPRLLAEGRRFGFIFIDGDHSGPAAETDIANALGLVMDGGVIAVHDFMEHCCCPEVMHAVNRMFPDGPDAIVGTMTVHQR